MTQINSKIVGALYPVDYDEDFFESMPFPIPYFNNKELKIGFTDPEHQPYLTSADKVLEYFLQFNTTDRIGDSDIVYRYYSETLKHGYTKPLEIKVPADVWNFITPAEIIIHWEEDDELYLCISCECAWEEEHGLQLVFKDGRVLIRASGHDGHFTD
jgi:hypothetical protein